MRRPAIRCGIAATQDGTRPAILEFITTTQKVYSTFRGGYHWGDAACSVLRLLTMVTLLGSRPVLGVQASTFQNLRAGV